MKGHLERFEVSGLSKELLIKMLEIARVYISGVDDINCFYIDKRGVLVLCQCDKKDMAKLNYIEYPFEATDSIIAEQAVNHIKSFDDEQLELFGQAPTGYEESYDIGWCLFKPEGKYYEGDSVEENIISGYDWYRTVLAIRPELIEWGK